MSPDAARLENSGMKAAEHYYTVARRGLTAVEIRQSAEWLYQRFTTPPYQAYSFADGFRRMAYILSQMKEHNGERQVVNWYCEKKSGEGKSLEELPLFGGTTR